MSIPDPPWQRGRRHVIPATVTPGNPTGATHDVPDASAAPVLPVGVTRRVLVIDDIAVYRDWVRDAATALGFALTAVATGEAAIAAATAAKTTHPFDLAIVDILMPKAQIEGMEAARALIALGVPCVMFTTVTSARARLEATLCGAIGYFVKDVPQARTLLVDGLTTWQRTQALPDPTTAIAVDTRETVQLHERKRFVDEQLAQLSGKQREVAAHAARGLTNKEIATAMGIALPTVNTHMQDVFMRLGLTSRRTLTQGDLHTILDRPDITRRRKP